MNDNDANHRLDVISASEQTEAGNYFVSNYPPFSLWSTDHAQTAIDRFDQPGDEDVTLGMYVHIPFCRKRCHFCYFRVYTDKNKDDIRRYMDAVIDETASLASKPFVNGRRLKFVYFGGGTPSYLSDKQLHYLFEGLQSSLPWDGVDEVAFECEPGTLNAKKLTALKQMGVTRLSLGIENFDDNILEINNRAHRSKQVYAAYQWARDAGFEHINVDLIAGMLGETEDNWKRCIDQTLRLDPDAVTIYQMEVPFNTTIYKRMKEEGRLAAPVAGWSTKRRWVREAFEAMEAAGYEISSAYTAVKDAKRVRFAYRDELWAGADMLAVGVSSFGHVGGVHYQNHHDIEPYVSSVLGSESPIYRALPVNDEELFVRQWVLQLKLGRIERGPFVKRFGIDPFERFADTLREYEASGHLSIDDDQLTFTRDGLLQVDRLLHAFFLPEHRGVRYA